MGPVVLFGRQAYLGSVTNGTDRRRVGRPIVMILHSQLLRSAAPAVGRAAGLRVRRGLRALTVAALLPSAVAWFSSPASAVGCTLSGSGIASSPYLVGSEADLGQVGAVCGYGAAYEQTADIVLTANWPGIGGGATIEYGFVTSVDPFTGVYDGAGFSISDLAITASTGASRGLFRNTAGAEIKDLTLAGVTIRADQLNGVGSLIGYALDSAVSGVVATDVDLVLTAPDFYSGSYAGGLIGRADVDTDGTMSVTDSSVEGTVVGYLTAGGLVGQLATRPYATDSTILMTGSSFEGSATARTTLGGVIGDLVSDAGGSSTTISGISVTGTLTTGYTVGGLVGSLAHYLSQDQTPADLVIDDVTTDVTFEGADTFVGGVVGFLLLSDPVSLSMSDVTVPGAITATGTAVGGLAGYVSASSRSSTSTLSIARATVAGDVTGANKVGGLLGEVKTGATARLAADVSDSSASGAVSGATSVGGVIGSTAGQADLTLTGVARSSAVTASVDAVGGLIGAHASVGTTRIEETTSSSDVTGPTKVGGAVGTLTQPITLADVSLSGDVAAVDLVGCVIGAPADGVSPAFEGTTSATGNQQIDAVTSACPAAPTWVDDQIGELTAGREANAGVSADGLDPIEYSVTGGALPSGLSLNASTGAITGTPDSAGPYTVTITATNSVGSVTTEFTGTVAEPAPEIAITLDFSIGANVKSGNQTTTVSGSGLQPNSPFRVVLRSDPVQIGAGTADADGTFNAVLTIPAGTPPGAHSATVYGIAPDGSEVVDVSYFTLDENGMVLDVSDVAPTRPYVPPTLPETGGSVSIAWLSLALLAGGSVLAAVARRRRHSAA